MRELKFNSTQEFEELFSKQSRDITDYIVLGIAEALKFQNDSANLFAISFEEEDSHSFEVTLPRSQWKQALKKCMDNYQKWDAGDEQIDVFLLLKEVKKWDSED
tara:strand:+ start:218 stop:529 length:312 start_codon:yes stop_codon:yes gene_type:complete